MLRYDFSLDEAIDVLRSREGWIQGKGFPQDMFMAYDKVNDCFVLNNVSKDQLVTVDDELGKNTRMAWDTIEAAKKDEFLVNKRYRFIGMLCYDSVLGLGNFDQCWTKRDYLKVYQRAREVKAF